MRCGGSTGARSPSCAFLGPPSWRTPVAARRNRSSPRSPRWERPAAVRVSSAAESIVAALPALGAPRRGARVVVVCGKGGNGGDGFVVARWLKRRGAAPSVVLACPTTEVGGDARIKLEALRPTGIRPLRFEDDRAIAAQLARAHVVIDALLGT